MHSDNTLLEEMDYLKEYHQDIVGHLDLKFNFPILYFEIQHINHNSSLRFSIREYGNDYVQHRLKSVTAVEEQLTIAYFRNSYNDNFE